MRFIHVVGLTALMAAPVSSCRGEDCFYDETDVHFVATPNIGQGTLRAELKAYGQGFACGCCGGKRPAPLVEYRWDMDGDGEFEVVDPPPKEEGEPVVRSATFETLGEHPVTVQVVDAAGTIASHTETVEVVDALSAEEELELLGFQARSSRGATGCVICLSTESSQPLTTVSEIRATWENAAVLSLMDVQIPTGRRELACSQAEFPLDDPAARDELDVIISKDDAVLERSVAIADDCSP